MWLLPLKIREKGEPTELYTCQSNFNFQNGTGLNYLPIITKVMSNSQHDIIKTRSCQDNVVSFHARITSFVRSRSSRCEDNPSQLGNCSLGESTIRCMPKRLENIFREQLSVIHCQTVKWGGKHCAGVCPGSDIFLYFHQ